MPPGPVQTYIPEAMELGIMKMRRLRREKNLKADEAAKINFSWSWNLDEANTQHPETTKDEAQQGSVLPGQQPPDGSAKDNADQANATTTEEKGLWDIAAEKAALEGGSTVKIFQAMKKKLKAKEKKQAVIAA